MAVDSTFPTIFIASVIDGADFDTVMARKAFGHENTDRGWATVERDAARSRLRGSGETDELFIEAIHYKITEMDYDGA